MGRRKTKLPEPPKVPRPLIRNLRGYMRKILSLSVENRIAQLSLVLQWYSNALTYLFSRNEVDFQNQKKLVKAAACRRVGHDNPNLEYKEAAFLGAIRLYEIVCKSINETVKVDDYYGDFQKKKELMELKQQRLVAKYGEAIRMLQLASGNRYEMKVAEAGRAAQYDSQMRSISFNREAARKINEKYRREGILAAFVDQLDTLARDSALSPNSHGIPEYDAVKHVAAFKELMKAFVEFAKSADAPNRLVKRHVERAPRVPGQPRVRGQRREKVAGRFAAGSSIAIVYERIKDGQVHRLSEVLMGLTVSEPFGTIRHLVWQGNRDKVWKVKFDKKADTVQMQHSFPVN